MTHDQFRNEANLRVEHAIGTIRGISLPSWCPECNDTERRSLVKINKVLCDTLDLLKEQEGDVDEIEKDVDEILRDLHTIIQDLHTISEEIRDAAREIEQKLDQIKSDMLAGFTAVTAAITACCAELQNLLKGADLIRATSGAFVRRFTAFSGATNLFQIDCFSIADELRWIFVFDGTHTSGFPIYIAPICPQMSTSLATPSPFQQGVTVGLSRHPTYYEEEQDDRMLVTATRRG